LQWARERDCPWDQNTCGMAAYTGTLHCCSGQERMAAPGTRTLARGQPKQGTWKCCSGDGSKAVPGIKTAARWQLRVVASRCCGGRAMGVAPGIRGYALQRVRASTWLIAVGAGAGLLPVGRGHLCGCGYKRPPGGAAASAAAWLPLGRPSLLHRSEQQKVKRSSKVDSAVHMRLKRSLPPACSAA